MEINKEYSGRICKNAKKYNIIVDGVYGSYKAIEEVERIGNKSIERMWRVSHIITEKEHIMRPSYLMKVKKQYDEKLKNNDYQNGLKKYLYNNCKRGGNLRNHTFELLFNDFVNIISQDCYYCGDKPQRSSNKLLVSRGHINEPPLYYNGVDRQNSEIGYVISNCVSCCGKCNYMKHILSEDDFYFQIEKIYNHSIKKSCFIE